MDAFLTHMLTQLKLDVQTYDNLKYEAKVKVAAMRTDRALRRRCSEVYTARALMRNPWFRSKDPEGVGMHWGTLANYCLRLEIEPEYLVPILMNIHPVKSVNPDSVFVTPVAQCVSTQVEALIAMAEGTLEADTEKAVLSALDNSGAALLGASKDALYILMVCNSSNHPAWFRLYVLSQAGALLPDNLPILKEALMETQLSPTLHRVLKKKGMEL